MNNEKRLAAGLIPYKITSGKILVYLQKRSPTAERSPNMFGIFGGGIKAGESSSEAMCREIKEELDFTPENYEYLGEYETEAHYKYVYTLQVGDDFEGKVRVLEGQYGKFFNEEEIEKEKEISDNNKLVIQDLFKKLNGK